ncbi:antibiotic biosynthesis monooxygenase [Streptomyces sp. NA02950]|uniref:antibiotic biosynthesis monooxygenase n=1 Tax=Streptomyces sp. NA02950 TaxID=2742137 RepID=UPI0015908AB1|nr:antibiotic biosynthesis monooxygenase [Streptomyces sp. NA02950]QKV92604.1 antibiotic biosynthesis monooxygenase [Streptomyces sp. NA02950]
MSSASGSTSSASSADPSRPRPAGPLPDLARPDVGAALFSTWSVGTPERQRAAVDAIAAAWDSRPWPTPDLLSYNVYAGTDGDTLMHLSQWSSEESYHAFVREHRTERIADIDSAVPGIKRMGIGNFRRYRGFSGTAGGTAPAPGLIVVIDIDFDAPDPVLRRNWVDAVIETLRTVPRPGLISADFHLNLDGRARLGTDRARVLNYAQWTDEEAYEAAVLADRRPGGPAARDRMRGLPGFARSESMRYHFARSFTPGTVGQQ